MIRLILLISACILAMPYAHAKGKLSKERIEDGFVHAQRAPQLGRPNVYPKFRDVFPKAKRHAKHKNKYSGAKR